ncbi:hypothetical protein Ancab_008699 [Ancistrocladus abbreviatus]
MEEPVGKGAHGMLVPFPATGPQNPMLQFGKCIPSKGVKCTLAATVLPHQLEIDTISDGCDEMRLFGLESFEAYVERTTAVGSKTPSELITRHSTTANPAACVIYDTMTPWVRDVTKKHGLIAAAFAFRHSSLCSHQPILLRAPWPTVSSSIFNIIGFGLPLLDKEDLPTLLPPEEPPTVLQSLLEVYANLDKADFVLLNTIYEWEEKCVEFRGRTNEETSMAWKASTCYYLWVIRSSLQAKAKLPKDIFAQMGEKGIVVNWRPSVECASKQGHPMPFNTLWLEFNTRRIMSRCANNDDAPVCTQYRGILVIFIPT